MAKIGVAISGGGYRASAWGLGVLWYLADAGLNKDVTMVSSVSGGSLTNAHAGWLGEDYTKVTAAEYGTAAEAYGKRLAGRSGVWMPTLLATLAGALLAYTGIVQGLALLVLLGTGLALVAGIAGALRCGDLLFNQWLVWLWIDGLAALIGLGVWWRHHGWCVAAVVLVTGVYLLTRNLVVGVCMGRSLASLTGRTDTTLDGLNADPLHVILATELHVGRQMCFAKDFVYNFDAGFGAKPTLPVRTAVQASSNLPGAFPTRWVRTAGMNLQGGTDDTKRLALTDGGVYDNMGDEWFTGFDNRMNGWEKVAGMKPVTDAVKARRADFVVVANASGRFGWRKVWRGGIPWLGELFGLFQVKDVLYAVGTTVRRQWDVVRFDARDPDGTLVHIATNPFAYPEEVLKPKNAAKYDQPTKDRATEALAWLGTLGLSKDDWVKRMDEAKKVGTQLWPLGDAALRNVVNAAYVQLAVNAHVKLNASFGTVPYPL